MKIAPYTLVAAALLALTACEPPTASKPNPSSAVDVVLGGTAGEMVVVAASDGALQAQCTVDLQATAKGSAGRAARWGEGRIIWYYGMDRSVVRDTAPVPAQEVITAWAVNSIGAGATQNSRWTLRADAPFKATMEMDYAEEGGDGSGTASYTFTCGPTPPAGGAPAPVVRNVQVSSEAGGDSMALPGRVITIRYEAQGEWGVWESGVLITGAFNAQVPVRNAVTAGGGGTVTGTVQVLVPAEAAVGQPIQVQGYAVDPFLQRGVAAPPRPMRVTSNVQPMVLSAYFKTSPVYQGQTHRLVGRFAEGDTMQLSIQTLHSLGPGWVVFALGGGVNARDSVAVPFSAGALDVKLPVRAGWAGASTLSVQVRNNEGMYSIPVTAPADSFGIYRGRTAPVRSATVATPAGDMALDHARGLLYLAMPHTGRVQVVSLATLSATSRAVTSTSGGMGLDLTRGGDTLIVALGAERALAVLDLSRPEAAPVKVPLAVDGVEMIPMQVRVAANGKVLVMGEIVSTAQRRVVEMSSSGTGQRLRADAEQAGAYFLVHRSADHGRLFFESHDHHCATVYDSDTDRFGTCRPLVNEGTWSSTPSGSRFASGYDVHDAAGGRVRTFPLVTGAPIRYTTGLTPDGSHLYASAAGGLVKLRVSDGAYIERLALPTVVDGRILFTGGGRYLVAVHARVGYWTEATEIHVVDLQ
ncbi:hypothetical protein [Longimicrobium sp.]|uniref:hypothetical protein n=1 Tax=Longimicrobium sp. TaxID=2029185 RepID=UPI002ED8BE0C